MAKAKATKAEQIVEFVSTDGPLAVDESAGIIRGVRVLGLKSKNGRTYKREAVTSAIGLYEGAKVNVDHSRKGESERSYSSRIGILKSVTQEADGGLRADLHYNPKHALAEQLVWDAKNAPTNVGLSHNVLGRTRRDGSTVVVESIERVVSVDLVADPATTNSLFENQDTETQENWTMADYATLTLDEVKKHRPDLAESLVKESAALAESQAKADADAAEAKALREELAAYKAKEAVAAVDAEIDSLVKEHKLPAPAVNDAFRAILREAKDKDARTVIVKGLAESIAKGSGAKPVSKEQGITESATPTIADAKSFASALTA